MATSRRRSVLCRRCWEFMNPRMISIFDSKWAVSITQDSGGKTPFFIVAHCRRVIYTPFPGVLQQLYPFIRGDLSLEKYASDGGCCPLKIVAHIFRTTSDPAAGIAICVDSPI